LYEILTERDSQKWSELLHLFKNNHDIYSTLSYCKLTSNNDDASPRMFLYKQENVTILYPFLLRNINRLEFVKNQMSEQLYDIITPYGYGGPITDGEITMRDSEEFRKEFEDYCKKNNIISEFIRFHPLLQNHKHFSSAVPIFHVNNTVSIFLDRNEDEILKAFHKNHQRNVKKARNNNLSIQILQGSHALPYLSKFKQLYDETMKKNNAKAYYYFSYDYFKQLFQTLGEAAMMANIKQSDEVIASAIFFINGPFLQYHLGASERTKLNTGANPFLFYEVAKWGSEKKMKYLHLGGGYRKDDPLFTFKKRFNEQGISPFYIGKKIHNKTTYEHVTQLWKMYYGKENDDTFFPKYRQLGDD
jgi:hypothetical protein